MIENTKIYKALLIAKLGNFSLTVYYEKNKFGHMKNYELIKKRIYNWYDKFTYNGILNVIMEDIIPDNYDANYEKIIEDDLNNLKKIFLIYKCSLEPKIIFTQNLKDLLKGIIKSYGLSLSDIENIKNIAKIIATINNREEVTLDDFIEAFDYTKPYNISEYSNAESNLIVTENNLIININHYKEVIPSIVQTLLKE